MEGGKFLVKCGSGVIRLLLMGGLQVGCGPRWRSSSTGGELQVQMEARGRRDMKTDHHCCSPFSDHSYSQADCARSTTTDIVYVKINDSSEQEVPLLKEPDESYVDCSERIFTTIEVAWANEDVVHLLAVVNRWAEGDRNAIGVKLWRSSDARGSVLVLTQARKSTEVHVWRYGQQAKEVVLPPEGNHAATILERPGPAAVLPGEWFCTSLSSRNSPDDRPPLIIWTLSELALRMESYYRAQHELRAPLGSEACRAMRRDRSEYFAQRLIAYVQAEVDDIRCAEGISEELRERLLEEKEEELEVCKRRVARQAEREQAG